MFFTVFPVHFDPQSFFPQCYVRAEHWPVLHHLADSQIFSKTGNCTRGEKPTELKNEMTASVKNYSETSECAVALMLININKSNPAPN